MDDAFFDRLVITPLIARRGWFTIHNHYGYGIASMMPVSDGAWSKGWALIVAPDLDLDKLEQGLRRSYASIVIRPAPTCPNLITRFPTLKLGDEDILLLLLSE